MPRIQHDPVDKTVLQLNDLDPFEDMVRMLMIQDSFFCLIFSLNSLSPSQSLILCVQEKRFFCTVTVDRLSTDQRWWFASCVTCRKSCKLVGQQYKCTGDTCLSVKAELA